MIKICLQRCVSFFKKEVVLCVALLLAVVSSFFVHPSLKYVGYIDFRTLAILFSLMCIMAGLKKSGVFDFIAQSLLLKVKSYLQLILILVLLPFFFAMVITNDVALITFVPFTFVVLKMLDYECAKKLCVPIIVLETVAANLGSMLTPIGNPQNLYLYELSKFSLVSFLSLMFPYFVIALCLLLLFCFILNKTVYSKTKNTFLVDFAKPALPQKENIKNICACLVLFVFSILTVAHVLPYYILILLVTVTLVIFDKKVFGLVDYSLLFTFIGFFVFIGNIEKLYAFRNFFSDFLTHCPEELSSIFASQIISNVPAALLLSGFTQNFKGLIIGTNLGGLGTLIASMASLISYKFFAVENPQNKKQYICYFSVINVLFLFCELLAWVVIK